MRLIDADKLIKTFQGSMNTAKETFDINLIYEAIDDQPTVFNKDEVLASLKEKMNRAYELDKENNSEYFEGEADAFYRSIQIIEKGGLE